MIPRGVEVFVATEPVDMRFGFERLGGIVRERMQREPRSKNAVFVFIGKRGQTLKVLWWDGTGTVLLSKRLDRSTFEIPRARENGATSVFRGYRGYLQSDASSVYDILDRGPPVDSAQGVVLVGCWAHCRRYFFEAAICKYEIGVQGLMRIRAIYVADNALAELPPIDRKRERLTRVLPLVNEFFAWVEATESTTPGRTLAAKALGYAKNQAQELRRVFLDGRLPLDNTRSERALRKVVVGRKNWMFYGSDVHAEAAAAVFSIVASCRLHGLDPGLYLDEVMRVLPYWPRDRFIELAPKRWRATRATLDAAELERPIGFITVPMGADASATTQN